MKTISVQQLKEIAKVLIDDGNNIDREEYVRGICELIADVEREINSDEIISASKIAQEFGVSPEAALEIWW